MQHKINKSHTVAVFGGAYSFTDEAFKSKAKNSSPIYLNSFEEIFKQVETGKVDAGIVPLKNSATGGVSTNAVLLKKYNIRIIDEFDYKIRHCLFVRDENIKEVEHIITHPQALLQCKSFIFHKWPKVSIALSQSTSDAAMNLKLDNYPKNTGVICSESAGNFYELKLLYKDIQDNEDNLTTFALIESNKARTI